ncbi:MAG TPA: VWA domain-containing protein [Blastocatellia bacterium]|nr:VWA domain-containing protein [Blastocatellia bacterium]
MNRITKPVLSSLTALLMVAPVHNQQRRTVDKQSQVIRLSTELVTVDAQVLNKKAGHSIGGLRQEDFEIQDDGVTQTISYFSQDSLPISAVLLFDLTDTVRPVLKELAASAARALRHLKPEDEVAVMVYAASAHVIQGFTRDRQLAVDAISKASGMESREAAFFNEAAYQAAAQLSHAANPWNRRVIIWFTDGVPNIPTQRMQSTYGKSLPKGSLHTEGQATNELYELGGVVCSLIIHGPMTEMVDLVENKNPIALILSKRHPPGNVYKYAEETGGEVIRARNDEIGRRLAELVDNLRTRYSLGYVPSNGGNDRKFHRIKVRLSSQADKREGGTVVKARKGYVRESEPSQTKETLSGSVSGL